MTRLQSAARDYAIAQLSTDQTWVDPLPYGLDETARRAVARSFHSTHRRLVRARLALYLRLLRRVEAWERAAARDEACHARDVAWERQLGSMHCPHGDDGPDDWAVPPMYRDPLPVAEGPDFMPAFRAWLDSPWRHRPWSPLWLSAPPWEPGITPAMRRALPKSHGFRVDTK